MIVSALHYKHESGFQALGLGAAIALRGRGFPARLRRAKWSAAVLAELAEPGRMVLIPVVERDGRVGEFLWHGASPTVSLMLGCAGEDLSGRTLTQILGAGPLRDALFQTCHRAFLSRAPQTAAVSGSDWRGTIDAQPSSASLTAVLTSESAVARAMAAQSMLRELEQFSRDGV